MFRHNEMLPFSGCEDSRRSEESTHRHRDAEIYTDGASSGNPGPAGIGVVIRVMNQQGKDLEISEYIGTATNNVAEYSALLRGLKKAFSLGLRNIMVYVDSELLVKQIKGAYRVKSETLRPLWTETQKTLSRFDSCSVRHVRREKNRAADSLAKKALREIPKD